MLTQTPLTQRQRDILSAAELHEAAACYPDGSKPAEAYWKLSDFLLSELGNTTSEEIGEALEAARDLKV